MEMESAQTDQLLESRNKPMEQNRDGEKRREWGGCRGTERNGNSSRDAAAAEQMQRGEDEADGEEERKANGGEDGVERGGSEHWLTGKERPPLHEDDLPSTLPASD